MGQPVEPCGGEPPDPVEVRAGDELCNVLDHGLVIDDTRLE